MAPITYIRSLVLLNILLCIAPKLATATQSESPISVVVDWNKTVVVSKTTTTLMVEVHPLLREGSPIQKPAFAAIKNLASNYVRYHAQSFWPKLVVAELEPPTKDKTFWDFSKIDSVVIPFLVATRGHEPILNFNTIPAWMFKTDKPVRYPDDPNQYDYEYPQGTELVDPSAQQVAEYYARIVSWYTQGGFTDELGHYHVSGYHYQLPWWGVLNEVQAEHETTPQQYVIRYDAIVAAIHKVSPRTKFVGLSLAPMGFLSSGTEGRIEEPAFFQFFLDPKNHRPGTPLDMLAYHFYAVASAAQTIDSWQYSFFDQADGFFNTVALIESIRQRLSPSTRVDLDEVGVILPEYFIPRSALTSANEIPPAYWNLCGALFAYMYVELAKQGVDVVSASQFLGDPKANPGVLDPMGIDPDDSIPLFDWKTARPNARFWVLKLLNENFAPGDRLVSTDFHPTPGVPPDVAIQAFATAKGKKLLVINKRATPIQISLAGLGQIGEVEIVDLNTAEAPPQIDNVNNDLLQLGSFAVAVVAIH